MDPGEDLSGASVKLVGIDLDSAVLTAVKNNLRVQSARLDPAITADQIDAAEGVFDVVLFGNVEFLKTDEPQSVPVLGGIPLGAGLNTSENARFETGVRKRFQSGGEASLSSDLNRSSNSTPGFSLSPEPAYTSAVRLGLTQPLLRGFGAR